MIDVDFDSIVIDTTGGRGARRGPGAPMLEEGIDHLEDGTLLGSRALFDLLEPLHEAPCGERVAEP